jgi:hypothetical protein
MPHKYPREPWHAFLSSLDGNLILAVALHCLGGFAIGMLYGLPRPTIDIDCLSVIPADETSRLCSLAGKDSPLCNKLGVYIQHVGVVTVPENYMDRLIPILPGTYRRLHLFGLEPHDLALSKLERNSARDREDVKFLARAAPLNPNLLGHRYHVEQGPYLADTDRHDLTIRLWLDMLAEIR